MSKAKRAASGQPGAKGRAFRDLAQSVYRRRRLSEGEVSVAAYERHLESARWSPSVANRQPWLLASAEGDSARDMLLHLARDPAAFTDFFAAKSDLGVVEDLHAAGALVVVLGQRGDPFWRESCLLAVHQMMLAAAAEGLAARVLLPSSPNALARLVRVPAGYLPFVLVLVGHQGEEECDTRALKPITDVRVPFEPDREDS